MVLRPHSQFFEYRCIKRCVTWKVTPSPFTSCNSCKTFNCFLEHQLVLRYSLSDEKMVKLTIEKLRAMCMLIDDDARLPLQVEFLWITRIVS